MADTRAVMAVGEAAANLLRAAYDPADFASPLDIRTITAREFASNAPEAGVSVFLYRITANGAHRIPAGRVDPDGRRRLTKLPVDLHFLLTVWGGEASLQHAVAGWMMRVLEDTPLLGPGALNAAAPGSFRHDESVEFTLAEVPTEDLLRIWEVLGLNLYQLSIPYTARCVRIESTTREPEAGGAPVQERVQDVGVPEPARTLGG